MKPWYVEKDLFKLLMQSNIGFKACVKNTLLTLVATDATFAKAQIFERSKEGVLVVSLSKFQEAIDSLNGKKVYIANDDYADDEYDVGAAYNDEILIWDHGVLTTSIHDESVEVSFVSCDANFAEMASKILNSTIATTAHGHVYVFNQTHSGIGITVSPNKISVPFCEDNYNDDVIKQREHIIEDLQNSTPCGRLIVLSGEPGTGKTFFVRSLIDEVPSAKFILVPANMLTSLDKPDIIKTFLSAKNNNKPLVLVLEDADTCLVERQSDNISSISSLLNMSDGIFGSMFNLRVIATTNVEYKNIDPAIVREGRLCTHVKFDKLTKDKANSLLSKLTKSKSDKNYFTNEASLAEVYKNMKKSSLCTSPLKEAKRMGFSK